MRALILCSSLLAPIIALRTRPRTRSSAQRLASPPGGRARSAPGKKHTFVPFNKLGRGTLLKSPPFETFVFPGCFFPTLLKFCFLEIYMGILGSTAPAGPPASGGPTRGPRGPRRVRGGCSAESDLRGRPPRVLPDQVTVTALAAAHGPEAVAEAAASNNEAIRNWIGRGNTPVRNARLGVAFKAVAYSGCRQSVWGSCPRGEFLAQVTIADPQ